MANALFLHPYYSDLGTITASTTASGLATSYLQTADPSRKWRSTSITTQWIGIDLGSALAATSLALIGGNLTSAATWKIGASNTNVATARSAPSLTAVTAGTSAWIGSKTSNPAWAQHINFAKWANSTGYRYWAIDPTDAGNADGYFEFGRLMLGVYWQPTLNVDQNVAISWMSADPQERTPYNKLMVDRRGNVARQFDLQFSSVDQDECEDGASELARLRGNGGDFLFCLDPEHTTRFPQWSAQCVFGSGVRKDGVPIFLNSKQCWAYRATLLELV